MITRRLEGQWIAPGGLAHAVARPNMKPATLGYIYHTRRGWPVPDPFNIQGTLSRLPLALCQTVHRLLWRGV